MGIIIWEKILESLASYAVEHGAHWGIRRMLKIVGKQSLRKLEGRITAQVIKDNCYLLSADPNRYLQFSILITNPTPWNVEIVDVNCSISYNEVIITHKALVSKSLPITLGKETALGKEVNILYDPFSSPLGLPLQQGRWKLKGYIRCSSYYGVFDVLIPDAYLDNPVGKEQTWEDAVNFVEKTLGRTS